MGSCVSLIIGYLLPACQFFLWGVFLEKEKAAAENPLDGSTGRQERFCPEPILPVLK